MREKGYATASKRTERRLEFIPKFEAFDGRYFKDMQELSDATEEFDKAVKAHNKKTKEIGNEELKLMTSVTINIAGNTHVMVMYQMGVDKITWELGYANRPILN